MAESRYLWIDVDTSESPVKEMEQVFQQVFGTKLYTPYAVRCYLRDDRERFFYNVMGLQNTVWGKATPDPIETLETNVEVIPLSSILLGGTVLGEL